ncbi:DegT/DnrJ/EryC1/StrS aminotransferase [Thermocrinis albus DSM 14484]|uniref:DegT/DnrJ/EryC1/StrS aminotransferase n=1 Tax=Thermocrinis albus (strain DSM 14484 / JCM 11386 / HI 11/12) TaxID=638303 RepID=D3SPH6_THEAH|nr:DegT/DnrJ/EryC1/StrS family aminotransferase [Thermocrinis albus]ADC89063.1 DegT/DnrJ/EryC1/StrS aminotransferase [Thermocrinis albus DSM 14484]
MRRLIPFKPYGYSKEDMISAVEAMGHPYCFSGLRRKELEDSFCQYSGRKYAVATRDVVPGLLALLEYLGLSYGDTVAYTPLSLAPHFAKYTKFMGLNSAYADVERWFFNVDVKRLSNVITSYKPKVLIVNNSLGIPADWDAVRELLKGTGIFLIEDSRETLFSDYKGRPAGSLGDVSFLAFSPNSVLRGYGGVILTDDALIYKRIREKVEPMDDIMASLLISQTKSLEERINIRRELAQLYSQLLSNMEGMKPQFFPKYVNKPCWSYMCVHLAKRYGRDAVDSIVELMWDDGIETLKYPVSQDIQEGKSMPHLHISHEVSTRAILLPLHEDMDEEDVYFVCERFKDYVIQIGAGSVDH